MRLTSQHSVNLPSNLSPIDHEPPASAGTSRVKRGLADNRKLWPPGVITVSLDLKDQKSTALAVDAIQEWAHNTPALQFRIVRSREGDIRICDDESLKGNWSVIGTDAGNIPLNEPTMHLERNDDSKTFSPENWSIARSWNCRWVIGWRSHAMTVNPSCTTRTPVT